MPPRRRPSRVSLSTRLPAALPESSDEGASPPLTLRQAAVRLGVTRLNTVRDLLLATEAHRARVVAGYDAEGRLLLHASEVDAKAAERRGRANWRVENLGAYAMRAERDGKGRRRCLAKGCRVTVAGRDRWCARHRIAAGASPPTTPRSPRG